MGLYDSPDVRPERPDVIPEIPPKVNLELLPTVLYLPTGSLPDVSYEGLPTGNTGGPGRASGVIQPPRELASYGALAPY